MPKDIRGLLVRVGIDQGCGEWNAPVTPDDWSFVYIPIPEDDNSQKKGMETAYAPFGRALTAWGKGISLPDHLTGRHTHLDPDFDHLTYGDTKKRGKNIATMKLGDFVIFYAGLRPIRPADNKLESALIGQMFVQEVVRAGDVPEARRHENAHTRRAEVSPTDVILRADRKNSGRYTHCIPIGSYRDEAYRVLPEILDSWGGLSCKNGYIHRSAILPAFNDPARFLAWLRRQKPELRHSNN